MSTVVTITDVIKKFDDYIRQNGGGYSVWYCGVASDPRKRLFNDHNVDENNGAWIYQDCGSDTAARAIEQHFLAKGCKGGSGGGERNTTYAYAYKITNSTRD